ncbi:MFS transporter [Peribacillus sp. SCS-37]|uniref:MFS transporter n=1 Tax=Paraperibacillus esterisolvens TaxID=3115296 RepID=UPI003905FBA3
MNRFQWFMVYFVSFIHFLALSHRMEVVPFLVDLKGMYHVGFTEVGGLLSAFLLGYAIFQIPAGILADRYSPISLIVLGLSLMMISSIIFSLTHFLYLALFLRFMMGASAAMIFSPAIKLISIHSPREKRGLSIGILEGAAAVGSLLTLTVFPILSIYVEWNTLFLLLSILLLPTLLVFLKVPKGENTSEIGKKKVQPRVFLNLLKDKKIHRLLGISFFGLFGLSGFLSWMPTYLETSMGYTKQEAGLVMAIMMIAQIIGAPLSGRLSDLMGKRKSTLMFGSILAAGCCLWLIFLNDTGKYFTAFLIGIAISWSLAPMLTLATELVHVNSAGSLISIMNTVGQLGSAISGYVFGMLYDTFGSFQIIWIVCFIACLIRIAFTFGELEHQKSADSEKEISI